MLMQNRVVHVVFVRLEPYPKEKYFKTTLFLFDLMRQAFRDPSLNSDWLSHTWMSEIENLVNKAIFFSKKVSEIRENKLQSNETIK